MKTKTLLVASAVIEIGIGLTLLASPGLTASILINAPFDSPADSVVGRVAGAALLALGFTCWRARLDVHSPAANGIISAMLLYNAAAVVVLTYAGIGLRLFSIALWPVVVLHVVMAIWCIACLIGKRSDRS